MKEIDGGDEIFLHDEESPALQWPPISAAKCSQSTKLKAMYGTMHFEPSLMEKPMTSFEIDIEWNALEFHPTENTMKKGGVYIAYTMGLKRGPHGYFGVQIHSSGGMFFLSKNLIKSKEEERTRNEITFYLKPDLHTQKQTTRFSGALF